jgi:hypothetical protein
MKLRQLLVAAPPALVVAMAAHAAGFGSSHVLGGNAGREFFGLGLTWLALLAMAGMLGVALHAPRLASARQAAKALGEALPGRGSLPALTATLAAGAGAFYVALEALEGHGPGLSPLALAVILPLALAIAAAVRLSMLWLARAGLSLADLARGRGPAAEPWFHLSPSLVPITTGAAPCALRRGRAPPPRA